MVEPRQEPVRPDRAVGQVAEDAVASRPPRACSGAGSEIGPRWEPRQRVAGVDEVSQVPVAAAGERGEAGKRRKRATSSPRRDRDEADHPSPRRASRKLSFWCRRRGWRRGRRPQGPARETRLTVSLCRPGIQGNGNSSKQEEDPDDVVPRLARLIRERRHAQRNRCQAERPRSDLVRPPDAPSRHQAPRQTSRGSAAARADPARTPASPPRGRFPRSPGRTRPGTAAR